MVTAIVQVQRDGEGRPLKLKYRGPRVRIAAHPYRVKCGGGFRVMPKQPQGGNY